MLFSTYLITRLKAGSKACNLHTEYCTANLGKAGSSVIGVILCTCIGFTVLSKMRVKASGCSCGTMCIKIIN